MSNTGKNRQVSVQSDTKKIFPAIFQRDGEDFSVIESNCPNGLVSNVMVVTAHSAVLETTETTMEYMLMDYVTEGGWPQLSQAEQAQWLGAYRSYMEAMMKAGVLKSSQGLEWTATATTVRVRSGKTQVLDGPYADSKEQLGGFHIIDVPDLDAALAWAARSPTALHGVVEVRPLKIHPPAHLRF